MQDALTSPANRRRALVTAGAVIAVGVALWFASLIPRTLSVFVIAAFIAFGVAPIVTRLERWLARPVAIAIVYLGLVITAIVLVLIVVPVTLAQVQSVAVHAPDYIEALQGSVDGTQRFMLHYVGKQYLPPGYGDLRGLIAARASLAISVALGSLTQILIGTFTATFIGISSLVLSAFFLLRGSAIFEPVYELLPSKRRGTGRALGHELASVFGNYVAGQAALCVITGALIFSFTLVSGFKFALLLGIIAGLAYAVPFVGMVVVHIVALILAAPQGGEMVIWTQAIVFTIARVSDNVFVPKVMSESVGVSPIVVMFATFAGGELFGLPGLLLGIPIAALAKVAWRFYRAQPAKTLEPEGPLDIVVVPDMTTADHEAARLAREKIA